MRLLFNEFSLPYLLKDSDYPVGGWAVELGAWLKGIRATKNEVGVLVWKGAVNYLGRDPDFDLVETYDPKRGLRVLKYFYRYIPAMYRAAKAYKPDVIIQACSGLNTGLMAFIADKLGVPFVYRVANDMDVDERYKSRLMGYEQVAFRYGLKKASAILCQNQYQHDCMQKQYPDTPLFLLHNPFDISREIPRFNARADKTYIAWLGVFSQQKNMSLLFQIAESLPEIEFKIAGMPSNKLDKETQTAIVALKNLQNVTFVGYVKRKDVLGFLNGSIALLSTSDYEGFSNTFLESLATGTPVVAPLRVDPDHIITKYQLGLTTENDENLPLLVSQLCDSDVDVYEQMAKRCYSYVMDNHAPAVKAEELIQILQSIVTKS